MISTAPIRTFAIFSIAILALSAIGSIVDAQTLNCRYDYAAARKESMEKNLPLLLEFGTENCLWCKKLDSITFRDPLLVAWLNERIIVLRLDGEREPRIAQALKITNYPTLILAAPNGNILTIVEGYMDAPKLQEHLQKFLAAAAAAEGDALARDYDAAVKVLALGDSGRGLSLLRSILEKGNSTPIHSKAKDKLRELEQDAQSMLVRARELEVKGQTLEALETLAELTRGYPGTPAEIEARSISMSLSAKPTTKWLRSRRAAELLAQAKDEFRARQYGGCFEKYEMLAANYSDLPEGMEAAQLVAEIKSNPELLGKVCQNLQDRLSGMYLALADAWIAKGNMEQAVINLEKVQRDYPGSLHAQLAQSKLAQIQARPDQRTDFKKQP